MRINPCNPVSLPNVSPQLAVNDLKLIQIIDNTLVVPHINRGKNIEISIKEPDHVCSVTHHQAVTHCCKSPSLGLIIDTLYLAESLLLIYKPHLAGPCELVDEISQQRHPLTEQGAVEVHLADYLACLRFHLSE